MDEVLRRLLERLAMLGRKHRELFDSDVRDAMGDAILDSFVRRKGMACVPSDFGLYSHQANAAAFEAIREYIISADEAASALGNLQFHDRLAAVQNSKVRTSDGLDYEDFFGHYAPELYDSNGDVLRTH